MPTLLGWRSDRHRRGWRDRRRSPVVVTGRRSAEVVVLVGVGEDRAVQVRQAGVALDDVLELAVVDLFVDLRAEQAIEIVEAVAVHQRLDLRDEHGVERLAEQTARHVRFGKAADPGVDAC